MAAGQIWLPSPKCRVCGAPSVYNGFLCERCRRLYRRGEDIRPGWRPSPETRVTVMQAQYDAGVDAYRCYYTELIMVEGDARRVAEWEHRTPADPDSVVLTTKLVNRMKTDLTEAEFKEMIGALARRFAGEDFDEGAFPQSRPRPAP